VVACAGRPADPSADRAALLRLHEQHREAHVSRQAQVLTATFADTFYSISRGRVSTPSRETSQQRFQSYFDRSTFQAWDDLAPPVIRISPDGRMAYVIVQKHVSLTSPDSGGAAREEQTDYAWLETWEKQRGEWRLTALASTDQTVSP
jgi:hypothetical protein